VTLTQYTDRTVDSTIRLQRILEITKRQGYAIVDQELEIGLRSLAVPIRNRSEETVAALNVGCHAQRINLREMQTIFLPHMQEAARTIGAKL
jgi:IclR family pca regulon transcriptional regulator